MEEELLKITGKITHVIYHNEDNFFTVLRFVLYDLNEKDIIVTGTMAELKQDILYVMYGTYVEHPRYGMQFKMQTYEPQLPFDNDAVVRYLSGPSFEGIGTKFAKAIVETLGEDCLNKIKQDPDILDTVPKMNEKKKESILLTLNNCDDSMDQLIQFLNIHGIGIRNIIRLNKVYGKEAMSALQENPYRVIDECDGFGFKTADKIAKSLQIQEDDPRRLVALLQSKVMDMCMRTGDSYVLVEEIEAQFKKETTNLTYEYDEILDTCLKKRSLVLEEDRIYPISQFDAEENISTFLHLFPYSSLDPYKEEDLDTHLAALQEELSITYDERQLEAIRTFFQKDFMILTGGPGTGKTTVVKAMVNIFKLLYQGCSVMCAAPTGRAAKRLAELTDCTSSTIHSLLQWDLETNTFGKNENEPLFIDLLIVDEFSMVDNYLFYNLCKACVNVKKICIIGDEDQLPSVSPGCVLKDMIETNAFPLIRLEHIYRQKEGSDVIELAHEVSEGYVDLNHFTNDVAFFSCDKYAIKDNVLTIVKNALEKGYSMEDIQVLACMYNGVAGIHRLNAALQECFNPPEEGKRELKFEYLTFREGDKILQLKNQPDDDVYNGDIGLLVEIIYPKEDINHQSRIIVDFDGILVEYTSDTFTNITLAYCISIHKSQGSEYPIVIMPVTMDYFIMLQRRLLYTGITRARRSLVLLGEKDAFTYGIETLDKHVRRTTLQKRIKEKAISLLD